MGEELSLVDQNTVRKWDALFAADPEEKKYPNLDLVRLVRLYFGDHPGDLLEYGFGGGVNLKYLLERGHTIEAIDASSEAKKYVASHLLKQRPDFVSRINLSHLDAHARRLPYGDAMFDYVVCVSVISLLGSQERIKLLLHEFARVMKRGAKMIIDINGPRSDFARDGIALGGDVYEYRGSSKREPPHQCYCPKDTSAFVDIMRPFFTVDDVGYSAHGYMRSEIQEFIICAHRA